MEYVTVLGETVPKLGLGTYKLTGRTCVRAVSRALDLGYRHIDTAEYYGNQAEIGEAIAASDLDRDELFLVTKVWRTNLRPDDVIRSATESIEALGVDAVDCLLIHWPNRRVPVADTLGAMNRLREEGITRHIGVSNFAVDQLEEAMAASDAPILTDQVRYHPFYGQADLLEFCAEHDVLLTAYTPLAKGRVADDGTLRTIGGRYGKTAAQVALRWLVQQEPVATIPKATGRDHLEENLDVFDFRLTDAEMERIFDLQGGLVQRLRDAIGL